MVQLDKAASLAKRNVYAAQLPVQAQTTALLHHSSQSAVTAKQGRNPGRSFRG
jgi:hypothetical protein